MVFLPAAKPDFLCVCLWCFLVGSFPVWLPFLCPCIQTRIFCLPYSLVIWSHFNTVILHIVRIHICVLFKNSRGRIYVFASDIKTHCYDFKCLVSAPDWSMLSLAFNTQAYNAHVGRHMSYFTLIVVNFLQPVLRLLCCVCFQSGCLWLRWRWAVCYSCCWLGFVGVSVVPIPAAATSAAGAARTHVAARDTVSTTTHRNATVIYRIITFFWGFFFLWKSKWKLFVVCSLRSR